jgi:hypothetical protein
MIPCGESISGIARVTKSSDTGLINVYPNPSSNRLYINVAENGNDNYGCRIYNMQGTECLSVNLISDSGEGIDISRLTEGIYQLVISHENRLYSSKFLKINP